MGDYDRTVVNHYNLPTTYPEEWPTEKDESEASDTEELSVAALKAGVRRSKSRYSALERVGSDRKSLVPGSQRTKDGRDNLVQKDEPDPLGGADSVVRILRQRGLPVEEDIRMRNRFLLSSTTFSPTLFLSQTHSNASTQSLVQGLDFLSRSIDQKSASLKVLVESNFERFVRAKATIDNVYTEMRNQGDQDEQTFIRPHSRQLSRQSGHFRNFSNATLDAKAGRKKNALTKESDYGTQGIRTPLLELSVKAEEVWGPALGGKEREQSLKAVAEEMESHRGIYEVGSKVADAIKRKDYEALVEEYSLARKHRADTTTAFEKAVQSSSPISDAQIHNILATGRMWMDVEDQISAFKREMWRRLTNMPMAVPLRASRGPADEHMELIGILLELGVEDNPIWVWLLSRYDHLKNKIVATCERGKVEIEILRRRLAAGEKPTPQITASYLRLSSREIPRDEKVNLDTERVVELWESVLTYLSKLLSVQGGLLGEIVDFWDSAQSFIDGHKQKTLPTGFDGQSRKHHHLSSDGTRHLQDGAVELVNLLRDNILSLFVEPPIEDISLLFSPLPPSSPSTPNSTSVLSPRDARFRLDPSNLPPPSPKRGESWEEFGFWPPYSNSLSGVHFLSKSLILIGSAASEMTSMRPISVGSTTYDRIKSLVNACRERSVRALCAAWNKDAESCKLLEDWTRAPEKRDITKMPMHFISFEGNILSGLQKVLYISEAMSKSGAGDIVTPPPAKLLQMVRSQFVASIYKGLSGMVENAQRPLSTDGDEWAQLVNSSLSSGPEAVDANNRSVRMLLTLSNLKALRTELVPQLVTQFETNFSVKLTEESKTIRDALGQIDSKLFQSYTRPTVEKLSSLIQAGITSPAWVPDTNRPTQVRPYVYDAMLILVLVHTEVTCTAAPLEKEILSYLLEQVSQALLDSFKQRPKYSLAALMQATLDTEFIAQTMSQYATDKASAIQSQIYLELDKSTNNDARAKLQNELSEMRVILKKLREGTRSEFACFKKQRGQRLDRIQT